MSARARKQSSTLLSLLLVGCSGSLGGGGSEGAGAGAASGGSSGGSNAGAAADGGAAALSGGDDADLRALLTEALTPRLCPRLLNSFVGLPGEGTASGPAAGTLPTAGRWWIRQCRAQVREDRMELSFGGPGWQWVDREASGFRIRQYMLFEAEASLSTAMSVGYDRQRRVVTLWMRAAPGVTAHITPRGSVTANATNFFATVVGGILPLTGADANQRARTQAEEIGSNQLRDRLGAGFTMTVDLASSQTDFMVGSLQRGEQPERPFPNEAGAGAWQLNQRSTVQPGGLDIVGPVDLSGDPQALDVVLEEGNAAKVYLACTEDVARYLDARFRDPNAQVQAPPSIPLVDLNQTGQTQRATLPRQACPTLLLLAPRPEATVPLRLRYRVAAQRSGASTQPSTAARYRVQLLGATVPAQNASGRAWDMVGGEADLYVTVTSIPYGRQVDRTPTQSNQNTATWSRWLPGTFAADTDLPLRFTAWDEDNMSDEVIGSADLNAPQLPAQGGEVTLPLRTLDASARDMGSVRLRIERLP